MGLLPALLVRFLPAFLMGFLPALLVRNLLALSLGFLPAFLNIVTFLHRNLLAVFSMRNIFTLRTTILLFLVALLQMLVDQLESKFSNFLSNFLPSLNFTIFVLSLCDSSILCNFQQFGCGQFLQFLSVSLFILRNLFLVINGLSFPLLMTFLVLLGFFLAAMLLEERCAVVYVGGVALGVALADVLVLLPALLGELSRALGGVLGLALLNVLSLTLGGVLSLALLVVLGLTLLGVFRLTLG